MKTSKKYRGYFLIIIISIFLIVPVISLQAQNNTISISNVQDFISFAEKCSVDSWSYNKHIVLKNDIDLTGITFKPIPIFSGTFDGKGYTIRGIRLEESGSHQGLFRYIGKDAVIQNLNVEGQIAAQGSKNYIGGLVGNNKGLIKNCTFTGTIKGSQYVGGIAGVNESTGKLIDCIVSGGIYAEHQTGGIVGENMGTILRCMNGAQVNTKIVTQETHIEKLLEEGLNNVKEKNDFVIDLSDIGGISGVNTGIIQNCSNTGTVGYEHIGYNVGGIAGRQSGYIAECHNEGSIYGRKEIGGIVGQMEPYTLLIFSQSKLGQLSQELNVLQNMLRQATVSNHTGTDLIANQIATIQDSVEAASQHTQSLISQTENMFNENISTMNTVSVTLSEALNRLIPISEDLTDLSNNLEESMPPIQKALDSILKVTSRTDVGLEELKNILDHMDAAKESSKQAVESFHQGITLINQTKKYLLKGHLKDAIQSLHKAIDTVTVTRNEFLKVLKDLEYASSHLPNIMDVADDMNDYISQSITSIKDSMQSIENATNHLTHALETLTSLITYLSDQPEVSFVTGDSQYQETQNNLYHTLGEASNTLGDLNNLINEQSHILFNTLQEITDQLFVVFNTLLDITNDMTSTPLMDEVYKEDISNDDTQEQTEGKVFNCLNTGNVFGDINIGGIAGAISIERSFDPEDDIEVKGNKSLHFIFQTRAVIRSCHNKGNITGKKDGVGGIVGTMKLGCVIDSIAEGKMMSYSGHYVGGIAGHSYSLIRSSYAKCSLEGGNYIGGIVGKGNDILNCYALVRIDDANEYFGSIAGDIESTGQVKENFFVSDSIGAIDNISYQNKAEPLPYETFLQIENLPSIFSEFNLNFLVNNQIIKKVPFTYGARLDPDVIPPVPEEKGYIGTWETFDSIHPTFDQDIQAVYTPFISTLESNERQNDTMPIILVEGNFIPEDQLILERGDYTQPVLKHNQTQLEQWRITIPNDGNRGHTIHYLVPEKVKSLQIYQLEDKKWIPIKTYKDGKYLVFDVKDNAFIISVVQNPLVLPKTIFIIMLILILILIVLIKARHSKKIPWTLTQSLF